MSGANRNLLADITHEGKTGEAAMKMFSPESIRSEKGTEEEMEDENSSATEDEDE